FSSRRRHTRSDRDWSSDVCSSDLEPADSRLLGPTRSRGRPQTIAPGIRLASRKRATSANPWVKETLLPFRGPPCLHDNRKSLIRSEERRVGKECRSWGSAEH